MKIIQVNGWLGRLNAPLARFIKSEKPDFVCLQEAFGLETKAVPQFDDQYSYTDELKSAGGFEHSFFSPAWAFTMAGKTIDEGNLILSRHTLKKRTTNHITNHYYVQDGVNEPLPNTRVLQMCEANLADGKKLNLANYQGYLSGAEAIGNEKTVESLEKVRSLLRKLPRPLIFCTDLNISPSSPALKTLDGVGLRNLVVEHGIKSTLSEAHRAPVNDRLSVACDYIFCSHEVQVQSFRVAEQLVSDHKALVLEFSL